MKISAHPTLYRGTMFRSRLEARWAAFFDYAKWEWQYEPNDYFGWVPDFALVGSRQVTLVEVKPIEWLRDETRMTRQAVERWDIGKMRTADREVLLLGAYPLAPRGSPDPPILGMLWNENFQREFPLEPMTFDQAILWQGPQSSLDFCAKNGTDMFRIAADHYKFDKGHLEPMSGGTVRYLWNRAGTDVQWRKGDD